MVLNWKCLAEELLMSMTCFPDKWSIQLNTCIPIYPQETFFCGYPLKVPREGASNEYHKVYIY